MNRRIASWVSCIGFGILALSCGAASQSKPPASHVSSEASEHAEGGTADEEGPSSAIADATSTTTSQPQTEVSSGRSETDTPEAQSALHHQATPIEVMTRRETAYLIDYPNSGALAAANSVCAEKAKKVETAAWAELAEKAAKAVREAKPKTPPRATQAKPSEETEADADAESPPKPSRASVEQDDAREAAEAQEAAIAEKVEAVRAQCLKEARLKFEADVIRFRRDGLGHIELVIYRRNGDSLKELYRAKVELDDSLSNKVKAELKEAGTGKRPIMKDRSKFEVAVPNSYSLEIDDPQLGRLPYLAKVGLVGN
jgi:hypothetical protein